jgi:hypothetical protein
MSSTPRAPNAIRVAASLAVALVVLAGQLALPLHLALSEAHSASAHATASLDAPCAVCDLDARCPSEVAPAAPSGHCVALEVRAELAPHVEIAPLPDHAAPGGPRAPPSLA